jgi:multidrug resistance protein
MKEFNSTNETLGAFVTTVFLIGYTFGPCVIAPLSEIYGRAILYEICIVLFIVFNVACAMANSIGSLTAFRPLAGITGSCPVTLGPGTVTDIITAEKRDGAMSAYVIGIILGPSLGPIAGGYLSPTLGWRWAFWLMAIILGGIAISVINCSRSQTKTELAKGKINPEPIGILLYKIVHQRRHAWRIHKPPYTPRSLDTLS